MVEWFWDESCHAMWPFNFKLAGRHFARNHRGSRFDLLVATCCRRSADKVAIYNKTRLVGGAHNIYKSMKLNTKLKLKDLNMGVFEGMGGWGLGKRLEISRALSSQSMA